MMLRLDELIDLVQRALSSHGMRREDAAIVARTIVAAERDGAHSHGLQRLPGYISSLRAGWVDARAVPTIRDASPGFVHANACNGFAQIALARADGLLRKKAQLNGIAALGIHNSHHFASLWPDLEPFAEDGFVALTMVNTRSRIVAWGARRRYWVQIRWLLPVRAQDIRLSSGTRRQASCRRVTFFSVRRPDVLCP